MIEIIVIIALCMTNFKNAKVRGKSGGAAIAYTLGLWIGAELLGAFIGVAISGGEAGAITYLFALLFAIGGGIASFFIAKSGTVVQNQTPVYPGAAPQQAMAYPNQQPPSAGQQPQPLSPHPGQQPQPVYSDQQVQPIYEQQQAQPLPPQPGQQPAQLAQPLPPHPSQQPVTLDQPIQPAGQDETATLVFTAKKVMGQFLVSSVTVEVNGVPYQAGFNEPINIMAPAGNVQVESYLNYLGKSGVAQLFVALAPNQTYQLEYKSPVVVAAPGTLNITQV